MATDAARPADRLRERIVGGEVVRLDGGLATTLEAAGADLSSPLWSAQLLGDDPDAVVAAHRAFVDAGAEVVLTVSYQLAAESLRRAGRDPAAEAALLTRSVELARAAAGDRAHVAGSLGPWGAVIGGGREYVGRYDVGRDDLVRFHEPRVAALLGAGVDALAFETVPAADELAAIARLLPGVDVPVWVSATTSPRDPSATPEGDPLAAAFAPVLEHGEVVAVGVNCVPPDRVTPALAALAGAGRPLVAEPNAGDTYVAGSGWVPARRPAVVDPGGWLARGARLIGGCCGTSPAALGELLAPLPSPRPRRSGSSSRDRPGRRGHAT